MSPKLILAIVVITGALVFYSVGVLGEARRKRLLPRDVAWFGAGLVCDATGTSLMSQIAGSGEKVLAPWASTLMTVSGTAAIALMAVHIVIAGVLLVRDRYRTRFHVVSIAIWVAWLVSYALGPTGLMA